MNDVALVDSTIEDLRLMIEESVTFQTKVSPVYQKISEKILNMLSKEEELAHMETKEMLKLLEISNKAQLAPVEQLTKLVQSVTALYQRSELQDKVDKLSAVVEEVTRKKEEYLEAEVQEESLDISEL